MVDVLKGNALFGCLVNIISTFVVYMYMCQINIIYYEAIISTFNRDFYDPMAKNHPYYRLRGVPKAGTLVVARYNRDGNWYRGRIHAVWRENEGISLGDMSKMII